VLPRQADDEISTGNIADLNSTGSVGLKIQAKGLCFADQAPRRPALRSNGAR
jgi:hypothetical protein